MSKLRAWIVLLCSLGLLMVLAPDRVGAERDEDDKVRMQDDCDPSDPGWNATGGCALHTGTVTEAEFAAFSVNTTGSPLALSVIGHPAWRNDPGYSVLPIGDELKVVNTGGRNHTFTEVAEFGGGRVPALRTGLAPAPECASAPVIPAGARVDIADLSPGLHKFQCCLHPWMRTVVSVE
jgi:hypothetical protein